MGTIVADGRAPRKPLAAPSDGRMLDVDSSTNFLVLPMKILVSACLLGHPVRYDGAAATAPLELLSAWRADFVPVCPESLGGLGTPRAPAEIEPGKTAQDVLEGTARVLTIHGDDVTEAFVAGARRARALADRVGARVAILKSKSPSCGARERYDGTFSGARVAGEGVAAAWFRLGDVAVFTERELEVARAHLEGLR